MSDNEATSFSINVDVYKPDAKGEGEFAAIVVIPITDKGAQWGANVNYFGDAKDGTCTIAQALVAWQALSVSIESALRAGDKEIAADSLIKAIAQVNMALDLENAVATGKGVGSA